MKRRTEGFGTTEYLAFAGLTLIIFLLCTCVGRNVLMTGQHPSQKQVRGHMGRIIQKCTMTAPEKRYQTIFALLEAL